MAVSGIAVATLMLVLPGAANAAGPTSTGFTGGCATAGPGWTTPPTEASSTIPVAARTVAVSQPAGTASSIASGSASIVRDIDPSGSSDPQHLTAFRGGVAFTASDPAHGRELWLTGDGTAKRLKDIAHGTASSSPSELTVVGSTLYLHGGRQGPRP